ncbi:MAG: GNAT family N-acetyltransferase [Armatimonadetes bacterium]|jgi:ribosomal-protein-alanine N-acetyltransferase|nr:GNAT family N-acetyltransferase [Armatimonadota bacterium]
MKGPDTFETARLTAERLCPEHEPLIRTLYQDERVAATLGGVRTDAEVQRFIADSLRHWEEHGFGVWVFRERATGCFVGRAGIRRFQVEGAWENEILYALMPAFWGQGYATEIARALVEIAFECLGLADVVSFTLLTNVASRRVMEKAGLRYEREITHAGLPHVLYRRRAGE